MVMGRGGVQGRSGCRGCVLVLDPVVVGLGLAAILLVDWYLNDGALTNSRYFWYYEPGSRHMVRECADKP